MLIPRLFPNQNGSRLGLALLQSRVWARGPWDTRPTSSDFSSGSSRTPLWAATQPEPWPRSPPSTDERNVWSSVLSC